MCNVRLKMILKKKKNYQVLVNTFSEDQHRIVFQSIYKAQQAIKVKK